MPLIVFLAAIAVPLSIPLLIVSLSGASTAAASRGWIGKLSGRRVAEPDMRQMALEQSATDRVVRPMLAAIAGKARRLAPAGWSEALERRITLAGVSARWPIERVLAGKLLLGAGGVTFGLVGLRTDRPAAWLLLGGVTAVLGFFTPDILLHGRAVERQQVLQRELPDALDQITMSVEAGLGFEAAVSRVAKAGSGPLAREFTYALQEMQIGISRHDALRNLATRTDVPDLRNFLFTVIQAESYGLPIANVLRVQSSELRLKRRQRAEEAALKVPVKIIFPLLLCIFPSLFIVLLGPAGIRIWRTFAA